MVCLSPVGYGVQLTFPALALRWGRLRDCGEISVEILGNKFMRIEKLSLPLAEISSIIRHFIEETLR